MGNLYVFKAEPATMRSTRIHRIGNLACGERNPIDVGPTQVGGIGEICQGNLYAIQGQEVLLTVLSINKIEKPACTACVPIDVGPL